MRSIKVTVLSILCAIQCIIIVYLASQSTNVDTSNNQSKLKMATAFLVPPPVVVCNESSSPVPLTPKARGLYKGVAITMFLHTPTWFQKRYSVMVRNIRSNIPNDWAIQVFYTGKGQSQNGLDINPGLQRMVDRGEVILTVIPPEISSVKKKYYEMWTESWLWKNAVAEKVLVFGGNAAICGNSPYTIDNFTEWDYLGSPWDAFKGVGGDGGISIRSRSAMTRAIDYELSKVPEGDRATAYKSWGQEDRFFVNTLLEMNRKGLTSFKLATRAATLQFSAIGSAVNDDVFVASGILPVVEYAVREKFLNRCPELKVLFPSLHDPNCFGASPNATKCAASICALQIPRKKGGC